MVDYSKYQPFASKADTRTQYEKNESKYGPIPSQGGYLGGDWPDKPSSLKSRRTARGGGRTGPSLYSTNVSGMPSGQTFAPSGGSDLNRKYGMPNINSPAYAASMAPRTTAITNLPLEKIGTESTYVPPEGEMPRATALKVPEYREDEAFRLGETAMAPALSESRRGLRELITSAEGEENPNVRRMIAGEALRGYGGALGNILAKGREAGRRQYGDVYGREVFSAQAGHTAEMANFQALLTKYMRSGTTKVTPQYGVRTTEGIKRVKALP